MLSAREIHRAVLTEHAVDNEGSNQVTHFCSSFLSRS